MATPQARGSIVRLTTTLSLLLAAPAIATTEYHSQDQTLTVVYQGSCSLTRPWGSYQVKQGVAGILIPLDCREPGGDSSTSRFIDTSGDERCYGQMYQDWTRGIITTWEVEGAVAGYRCSTIGQTYRIPMDSGREIPDSTASSSKPVTITEATPVALDGIGPIRIGMTIKEAAAASGLKFRRLSDSGVDRGCTYFQPTAGLAEVGFMVTHNRIARIDIYNNRMATLSGARVGDRKEKIMALYGEKIQLTGRTISGRGEVLTFFPSDPPDQNLRLVFEVFNQQVSSFRIGKLPEVEYPEGCS